MYPTTAAFAANDGWSAKHEPKKGTCLAQGCNTAVQDAKGGGWETNNDHMCYMQSMTATFSNVESSPATGAQHVSNMLEPEWHTDM